MGALSLSLCCRVPACIRLSYLRLAGFFLVTAAPAALAHDDRLQSSPGLWTAWNWDPWIVCGLAVSAWLYWRGVRALWQASAPGRGVRRREAMAFMGGWVALGVALISPLHALSAVLFSAHMVQHLALMLVAAPLLVLGKPLMPFLWALPPSWRRQVGKVGKAAWVQGIWHMLTAPVVAWTVHAVVLWMWHVPGLLQATLANNLIHAVQHFSFLGAALLFWWALLQGRQGSMGYGAAVLWVFTTAMHSGILGALLVFAPTIWYPAYMETTVFWGLTPLEDQQLAGLIMWVPAGMLYLLAALMLCAGWLRELERKAFPWHSQTPWQRHERTGW
jgi:putative membrane protein